MKEGEGKGKEGEVPARLGYFSLNEVRREGEGNGEKIENKRKPIQSDGRSVMS